MGSCPVVTGKTVPSCTWWGTPQAGRLVGSSPLGVTSARPWCALGQGGHLASQVQSWGLSLVETVRSPHVPGCGHTPIVLILPSFPPPPHLPPRSHPPGSCSVTQSCLTLFDLMECSTPDLPVPHHLPKFAQVRVLCIGGAIQLSHPLMPSFLSALNLCQHQGLFQ